MARVFENARDGLNYDVYGGAVPNSLLYRIKQIEGLSKQTLQIVPSSGQGLVYNGNKIIVSLPMNSLLDLGTFEMNFYAKTAHNGAISGAQKNYVQTRFFPRNIQSLISNLEIKINGRSNSRPSTRDGSRRGRLPRGIEPRVHPRLERQRGGRTHLHSACPPLQPVQSRSPASTL